MLSVNTDIYQMRHKNSHKEFITTFKSRYLNFPWLEWPLNLRLIFSFVDNNKQMTTDMDIFLQIIQTQKSTFKLNTIYTILMHLHYLQTQNYQMQNCDRFGVVFAFRNKYEKRLEKRQQPSKKRI
jgi:hypothetical protein